MNDNTAFTNSGFLTSSPRDTYSASVAESVLIFCVLLDQLTNSYLPQLLPATQTFCRQSILRKSHLGTMTDLTSVRVQT